MNKEILGKVVILLLVFFLSGNAFPVQPGGFEFSSGVGYFLTDQDASKVIPRWNKDKRIVKVNFDRKDIWTLVQGESISNPIFNYDESMFVFIDHIQKKTHVFHLEEEKTVESFDYYPASEAIEWVGAENVFVLFDDRSNHMIFVDLSESVISKVSFHEGELKGLNWFGGCDCVYFEFIKKGEEGSEIYKLHDGEIDEARDIESIAFSKDGRYYYKYREYDTQNIMTLYDRKEGTRIFQSNIATPVDVSGFIWTDSRLRILGTDILINLNMGELVYGSEYAKQAFSNPISRYDVAADESGYVLVWDEEEKYFEVEDISTGKIVKKYKKFW